MTGARKILKISSGHQASDGAGVKLTRFIGSPEIDMIDPFLLLDYFSSDRPGDYIGGFPDHPHRGFETVTYLLAGRMRHKDNAGHEGVIEAGDVQWMTAGRGIIHSEMPEQEDGLLQGFQLWVNLPAQDKMMAPAYQEFSAENIPVESQNNGTIVKVISGTTDMSTIGAVENTSTKPLFLDVSIKAGSSYRQAIPKSHNGFIFVINGGVKIDDGDGFLTKRMLGILGNGDHVTITSDNEDSRFLLIAGQCLNEPVVRGGPFVMNTQAEILRAFQDYKDGNFRR
ncbi:Pirin [hydrothermal vent metagenome]|uniref:Pirin n=1 Tax=hydrothermal vent metagenome TaxID=652676 RepID=A0A3B1B368_9ZZZZ